MRRSMDWTLEDNMVDGLFFCAILTGRRAAALDGRVSAEWSRCLSSMARHAR